MNRNLIARPAVDELLELVQTRLGMTENAAREYIWQRVTGPRAGLGALMQSGAIGERDIRQAADELHRMPALA